MRVKQAAAILLAAVFLACCLREAESGKIKKLIKVGLLLRALSPNKIILPVPIPIPIKVKQEHHHDHHGGHHGGYHDYGHGGYGGYGYGHGGYGGHGYGHGGYYGGHDYGQVHSSASQCWTARTGD